MATKADGVELHRPTNYIRLRLESLAVTMKAPCNQEIVNDTAKLIMHRLIARSLGHDPSLIDRARVSLAEIAVHFPDRTFLAEWEELLDLPAAQLRSTLTRRDERMRRLRVSSPFVTAEGIDFTNERLRRRIRRTAARIAARSAQPERAFSRGPRPMAA